MILLPCYKYARKKNKHVLLSVVCNATNPYSERSSCSHIGRNLLTGMYRYGKVFFADRSMIMIHGSVQYVIRPPLGYFVKFMIFAFQKF